jgi:succinate-acetate transporter protein
MGYYLALWAVFSFGLMIASTVAPRVLTGVLALTVVLLGLLAVANWADSSTLTNVGGWEGVLTGASAVYLAFAFLLNDTFGRTLLPVGDPLVR